MTIFDNLIDDLIYDEQEEKKQFTVTRKKRGQTSIIKSHIDAFTTAIEAAIIRDENGDYKFDEINFFFSCTLPLKDARNLQMAYKRYVHPAIRDKITSTISSLDDTDLKKDQVLFIACHPSKL